MYELAYYTFLWTGIDRGSNFLPWYGRRYAVVLIDVNKKRKSY